ncbi:MAG: ribosome-recycling factor, partial [Christensenellales bacterium]
MKLDTKEFEARMKKSISVYEEDLDGIRVGRANPSLLAKINVDYYGSPTPINNVAEVKVTDARTIVIQPWEAKLLKHIGKAI